MGKGKGSGKSGEVIPPVPAIAAGMGMGRPLNVAVAVGVALRREVNAKHPSEDVLDKNGYSSTGVDVVSLPSAIPKRVQLAVPKNAVASSSAAVPVPSAPAPAPGPTNVNVNTNAKAIRSPLRPVPGKENGYVKFKVKAIESKNGTTSASTPIAPIGKLVPAGNGGLATRGALRMKDRNTGAGGLTVKGQARESVDLGKGKGKVPTPVEKEKENGIEKTISPRRSLLRKSTCSAFGFSFHF